MAMSVGTSAGDTFCDINTTPLIDVMLVLLVTLIVTLPIMTHAVKLDMPNVTNPPPPPPTPPKLTRAPVRALFAGALIAGCAGMLLAGRALAEEGKNNVSAKMAKPLKAAQDDLTAKRYSDAILKLKESQASPGKSPYDQHVINEMLKVAYVRTGNYADAAKVMEAEIDDGFVPQSELQGLVRSLAQVNYQIKNYE